MFKRSNLIITVLLSLLVAGAVAIARVGEPVPLSPQNFWRSLAPQPAEAAGTIYVDASATSPGTGTSWACAYTSLQNALAAAVSGDQIWVAAGVYYPDEGGGVTNDDRTATFTMLNGVAIYGGFAGTEPSLGERDWDANVTVLSGDLEQNDTTGLNEIVTDVANIAGSNAYHVVSGGGAWEIAVLDGFTITAGNADGIYPDDSGGGVFNVSSSPMLTNVIFSGNKADEGGGMYDYMINSTPKNVSFTGNNVTTNEGEMYSIMSSPTLTNTILWNNQAGILGSEIYNGGGLNPTFFYSDIKGSGGSGLGWDSALGIDGGNNIDADPLFLTPVDPATAPTTAGDLHLRADSQAVDVGDNGVCPATDLDGNKRPIDGDGDGSAVCDLGAYEKLIDLFLPLIMR